MKKSNQTRIPEEIRKEVSTKIRRFACEKQKYYNRLFSERNRMKWWGLSRGTAEENGIQKRIDEIGINATVKIIYGRYTHQQSIAIYFPEYK